MAIVFDEVTGEIAPPARAGDAPAEAATAEEGAPALSAEALHDALRRRERLLARLSAD